MAACAGYNLCGCRGVGRRHVEAGKAGPWEQDCVATVSGYVQERRERRADRVRCLMQRIGHADGKIEVAAQYHGRRSTISLVEARIGAQGSSKNAADEGTNVRGAFTSIRQKAVAGAATLIGVSLALCSPASAETLALLDFPPVEDVLALEARLEEQAHLEMEEAMRGQDGVCSSRLERAGAHDTSASPALPVSVSSSLLAPELAAVTAFESVSSPAIGICVSAVAAPAIASLATAGPAVLTGAQMLTRAAQHFGGGGIAGAVGAALVYPLDTIKTRMQAQHSEGEVPQYKNEYDCFTQLVTKEGPASLYDGLLPQLVGIAPEKAMKLTVNELLLEMLETTMPGARIWALEFIAGGGGGFSQVVFTNPMEMVKVRLQTQSKEGVPQNAWEVVKDLGVQGLYTGAAITMARDVPSSAIFFSCYTFLRQLYPDHSLAAGCLAAIPATVLVTPLDIVKTRLQKSPVPGEEPVKDAWKFLRQLWVKEGPEALFKGSLVRVLRTSPQFGVTLLIYDSLCK